MRVVKKPLRIYVAGPLSDVKGSKCPFFIRLLHSVEADKVAKELFLKGHWPFCPHTQFRWWFEDVRPEFLSYELIVEHLDIQGWLSVCDAIFLMPGWEESRGASTEAQWAKQNGLQIFHSLNEVPEVEGWREKKALAVTKILN